MGSLKFVVSILLAASFGLFGAGASFAEETYYQGWPEKTDIDPHHDWTIKVNQPLDEATINESNIYVFQNNSPNVEGVKLSLGEDLMSIKVEAPEQGYKAGEEYALCIEKSVKSSIGKELKQPIMMKFIIADSESNSEKVTVPDTELKSLIQETLYWAVGSSDITKESMLQLKGLNVYGSGIIGIKDLTGLEYALNLEGIYLGGNQLSDISPLVNLKSLRDIDLSGNQVSDISPLINLTSLESVVLNENPLNEDAMKIIKILEGRGVSVSY